MTKGLIVLLAVSVLLGVATPNAVADQVVIIGCRAESLGSSPFVTDCGTSTGVPVACPVLDPFGITGPSCAQTLASFLSLPGYQLVSTSFGGLLYTIIKK